MGNPNRHIWRFVLWPISVWMSIRDFEKHMADDYVEQTSPIMATAVAFWVGVVMLGAIWFGNGLLLDFHLLLWFLPPVYAIGLALYVNREREFDKPKT